MILQPTRTNQVSSHTECVARFSDFEESWL